MFVSQVCKVNIFCHEFVRRSPQVRRGRKDRPERSPEGRPGWRDRPERSPEGRPGWEDRPERSPEGPEVAKLRKVPKTDRKFIYRCWILI